MATIGFADVVAETTASLVKIYSDRFSDQTGRRKGLTIFGYTQSTLVKPCLYIAIAWGWVLGVRFVDRVGKGIRTAPRNALLASSVTTDQRGFAFGLHRAGDTAGAFSDLGFATLIIWLSPSGVAQLTHPISQMIVLASIIPAALPGIPGHRGFVYVKQLIRRIYPLA